MAKIAGGYLEVLLRRWDITLVQQNYPNIEIILSSMDLASLMEKTTQIFG